MSLCGRDRKKQEIDLKLVIAFLQMLLCMAAGIAVLNLIGMVLSSKIGQNLTIYQMTLAVNVIMLAGGSAALKWLKMKNRKLEEGRD